MLAMKREKIMTLSVVLPASPANRLAAAIIKARVVPSVAHIDPEVAWVCLTEDQERA